MSRSVICGMAAPSDLCDKVALVTGSSRGIGAGIASALGDRGARCVVNYVADAEGRNRADAEQVAAGIPGARVIECDVGDRQAVAAMMNEIGRELGRLDILVNNAGILRDRTIAKMSEDEWADVLRVNLTGAFYCIQKAMPLLRPGGRVVSVSSVSGWLGSFGQANYAASKAGIAALTKVTARELARRGITANAVAPGFIDTEMTRTLPADVTQRSRELIPAGRLGKVDDARRRSAFSLFRGCRIYHGPGAACERRALHAVKWRARFPWPPRRTGSCH
jgi:3-oxoacyl-[acyl-carrier protein] reductase